MAVNKRDLDTLTGETGWPVVNYAQEERNLQNSPDARSGALSIPRFKFTWLVEFQLNPRVMDNPITNLREFITDNGKLYTHLISIDHPSPTIATETIRSYNKWINVPTRVDYPDASMTFHDDSTSVVMALWKEHLNFYSHQATIGDTISGIDTNSNLGSSQEVNSFQFTDDLTATDGGEMRSKMGTRPSLGMRLKPNDGRHFFESIIIYDLGTEPDAVNAYWFHHPMITGWSHDNLDKEDRTGNVRVSASFNYEGYYFTIGQNRGRLADYIRHILGAVPGNIATAPRKDGIARDGLERFVDRPVQNGQDNLIPPVQTIPSPVDEPMTPTEPALESELNPNLPASLKGKERDLAQTREEINDILNDVGEGESDLGEDEDKSRKLAALQVREAELVGAIKEQKAREANRVVKTPEEKSALENTQVAEDISGESPSSSDPNPERTIITDIGRLRSEADSAQREAFRLNELSRSFEELAQSNERSVQEALDRGDNRISKISQCSANAFRAKSNKAGLASFAASVEATTKRQAVRDNEVLLKDRASLT